MLGWFGSDRVEVFKNIMGKPYKRLQSQGQGHVKWPTVVASLMLIACLVAETCNAD